MVFSCFFNVFDLEKNAQLSIQMVILPTYTRIVNLLEFAPIKKQQKIVQKQLFDPNANSIDYVLYAKPLIIERGGTSARAAKTTHLLKERNAVHDQLLDKFIYTLFIIRLKHRFVLFLITLAARRAFSVWFSTHTPQTVCHLLQFIFFISLHAIHIRID